jgi:hypothetical protein
MCQEAAFRAAYLMTHDAGEAEDAVQEACMKASFSAVIYPDVDSPFSRRAAPAISAGGVARAVTTPDRHMLH